MEFDRLTWVLCLALFLVIGFNAMIYLALRGKKSTGMGEALHHVSRLSAFLSQGVRNPWEAEDAALSELSELVADLTECSSQSTECSSQSTECSSQSKDQRCMDHEEPGESK